jgi:hypothetical protein
MGLFSLFANKSKKQELYDDNVKILHKWVISCDGKIETLIGSSFIDTSLCVNIGAIIYVGEFHRNKGEEAGFLIEINEGRVLLAKLYFPSGIASWHKRLIGEAHISGTSLYKEMNMAEKAHHEKFPMWKDIS